jgi:hypothetical protein
MMRSEFGWRRDERGRKVYIASCLGHWFAQSTSWFRFSWRIRWHRFVHHREDKGPWVIQ